eukprot:scaffold79484_cov60-Phaeocystis_antarctica.AAC.3
MEARSTASSAGSTLAAEMSEADCSKSPPPTPHPPRAPHLAPRRPMHHDRPWSVLQTAGGGCPVQRPVPSAVAAPPPSRRPPPVRCADHPAPSCARHAASAPPPTDGQRRRRSPRRTARPCAYKRRLSRARGYLCRGVSATRHSRTTGRNPTRTARRLALTVAIAIARQLQPQPQQPQRTRREADSRSGLAHSRLQLGRDRAVVRGHAEMPQPAGQARVAQRQRHVATAKLRAAAAALLRWRQHEVGHLWRRADAPRRGGRREAHADPLLHHHAQPQRQHVHPRF